MLPRSSAATMAGIVRNTILALGGLCARALRFRGIDPGRFWEPDAGAILPPVDRRPYRYNVSNQKDSDVAVTARSKTPSDFACPEGAENRHSGDGEIAVPEGVD